MNVGRMMEFARLLLEVDGRFKIQKRLSNISARLQEIINAPQEAQHQTNMLSSVSELRQALEGLRPELNPPLLEFLDETGGQAYFTISMAEEIADQVRSSGITPTVAKTFVDRLNSRRGQYLENLKAAGTNLKALNFHEYSIAPGDAEIGFKIPRSLFENNLDGLAGELEFIDFTVFTFAEAVTGDKQHAKVAQLSTTDPLVLVTAGVHVVGVIAASVKWMLDAYAKYLEILELRERLKSYNMTTQTLDEVTAAGDKEIEEAIEAAVQKILKKKLVGRAAELANGLRYALRGLIARIERGMTIEVRFLPAPKEEGQTEEQAAEADRQESELRDLQRNLVYPPVPEKPLLAIPARHAKNRGAKSPKPRKKRTRQAAHDKKDQSAHADLNGRETSRAPADQVDASDSGNSGSPGTELS